MQQDCTLVDELSANHTPGHRYTAPEDRQAYGLNGFLHGRVTLYFNPHDQVISATPVQGIGWRGMSAKEIADTGGDGVFTQRVFAQNHLVGQQNEKDYDIWQRDGQPLAPLSQQFWHPPSKIAEYSIEKGLRASRSIGRKILTFLLAPVIIIGAKASRIRINALPPEAWQLPIKAPKLPEPFLPRAKRLGKTSAMFDEGLDIPADGLNAARMGASDQAYAAHRAQGRGNADSEASLRYEMNGMLRMEARRAGLVKPGDAVTQIDQPESATEQFKQWRNKEVQHYLAANIDTYATDHSTILTCADNAEKALAYDVTVGVCMISKEQLHTLRIAADWSLLKRLDGPNYGAEFLEYFETGKFQGLLLHEWANAKDSPVKMPKNIISERQNIVSRPVRAGISALGTDHA